jgi:hypothetical protein
VQRLVDGKKMRQEVAICVHELVDPLDAHRSTPTGLDRERRIVEAGQVVGRAVAPDSRRLEPHALREDVLAELPDGDLVVVDSPHGWRRGGARHRRRDHEWRHVLWDDPGRERPAGHLRERSPGADSERQEQDGATRSAVLEKLSTRDPSHHGLLVATGDVLDLEASRARVRSATSRPAPRPNPRGRHPGEPASTRPCPWQYSHSSIEGPMRAAAASGLCHCAILHRPSPPTDLITTRRNMSMLSR